MGYVLACYEPYSGVFVAYGAPVADWKGPAVSMSLTVGETSMAACMAGAEVGCFLVNKEQVMERLNLNDFTEFSSVCPKPDALLMNGRMRDCLEVGPGVSTFPQIDCDLTSIKNLISWIKSNSLEYVSVESYVNLWRAAGAIIGRWNGKEVVWEERS